MFLISDSITPSSWHWKRKCCGDSAAEWSQHQWKRCKKFFFLEKQLILIDRERAQWNRERGRESKREKESVTIQRAEGQREREKELREGAEIRREFEGEHTYEWLLLCRTHVLLLFIPYVNQSISLFKEQCMYFSSLLRYTLTKIISLSFYPIFSFNLPF